MHLARGAGQLAGDRTMAGALPDVEAQIQKLSDWERRVLSRVLGRHGLPPVPPTHSVSR